MKKIKILLFLFTFLSFSVSSVFAGGGRIDTRGGQDNIVNNNISIYGTVHKPNSTTEFSQGEEFEIIIPDPRPGDKCTMSQAVTDSNGGIQADCTATTPGQIVPIFKSKANGDQSGGYVLYFRAPTPTSVSISTAPTIAKPTSSTISLSLSPAITKSSATESATSSPTPTKIPVTSETSESENIIMPILVFALILGILATAAYLVIRKIRSKKSEAPAATDTEVTPESPPVNENEPKTPPSEIT